MSPAPGSSTTIGWPSSEREHGPLLEWLRTNAGLETPPDPASLLVTEERAPTVEISPEPTIGNPYVPVITTSAYLVSDQWFPYNAEKIERGTKGHADTQNALANFLQARGLDPRKSAATEPDFDLAWLVGETVFVAEVKSTTNDNEEHQLRLDLARCSAIGIGSLLKVSGSLRCWCRSVSRAIRNGSNYVGRWRCISGGRAHSSASSGQPESALLQALSLWPVDAIRRAPARPRARRCSSRAGAGSRPRRAAAVLVSCFDFTSPRRASAHRRDSKSPQASGSRTRSPRRATTR